jgi:hypothetical protein
MLCSTIEAIHDSSLGARDCCYRFMSDGVALARVEDKECEAGSFCSILKERNWACGMRGVRKSVLFACASPPKIDVL